MLLAHLSDPHLTTSPLSAGPAVGLHAALGRRMGLPARPDALVITGDLAENGDPQEDAQRRTLLEPVGVPVYLAIGNHDDSDAVLAAFAGTSHLAGGTTTRFVARLPGAALVVLDSSVPGSGSGRLGDEQLAWLADVLAAHGEQPVFLAMHHPSASAGIPFLDAMGLTDAAALAGVLSAPHPGGARVVRVLCGHVHRVVITSFAGTLVSCAGSTYRQSVLDLGDLGRMGYADEPASMLVHQISETRGGQCVTHVVPVATAGVQFSLPPG